MTLENSSGEPITELYVQPSTNHRKDMRRLTIEGASEVMDGKNADGDDVKDVRKFNTRLFRFDPPLLDGKSVELDFEAFLHAPRLADGSAISKNGTFLNNWGDMGGTTRVIPVFGPPDTRITSSKRRRKLGLEKRPNLPTPTPEGSDLNIFGLFTGPADTIDFEGRICTDETQIPIAPGNLISEERDGNGRTCRTYKTNHPISNFFSILSGEYTVSEDSWNAPDGKVIPIRVYHAKHHDYSLSLIHI